MNRIKELDYLRGLAALGIVFYHYMKWLYIYGGAQTFVGRLSVYGVEIFYILSGITLIHVYAQVISANKNQLASYFSKRFFRIFPLFWLSTILAIIIALKHISFINLFLNFTGLFSIFAWDSYIAPGTWSIGNELVFYLLFPFLVLLWHRKPIYFALVSVPLILIFHYFAFYVFDPNDTLHNQWSNYVNPLNHLFLFYVGMSIPIIIKRSKKGSIQIFSILLIGCVLLFALPSGKDGIHLLYGLNRWLFSAGAVLICLGFYMMEMKLPDILHKPLKLLGEISYGIYLLHPFVYQILCMAIRKLSQFGVQVPKSNAMLIATAVILTIALSTFIYRNFETYFKKKGPQWLSNFYKS